MNKDQFYFLISNYTSVNKEETQELVNIQNDYPYSQVVHAVLARAFQENNLENKENFLHLSAIYSTDRSVLKSVMTAPVRERKDISAVAAKPSAVVENVAVPAEEKIVLPQKDISGDELYEEVRQDLERLRELRLNFEHTVEELERDQASRPKPVDIQQIAHEDIVNEGLIEEIKTTKQKVAPEGPKQHEQIQIIDAFIKTQPTISRGKQPIINTPPPTSSDLSEDSVLFSENIVSETLVEILLKQGKKDKAIEVLKKLIWKFPQKKTYFATQIEELKK